MRTKTAMLTAALVAAGALSSVAQNVYSVNVVGYVNVPVQANRFYLIQNPLDKSGSGGNVITNVLVGGLDDSQAGANVYTFSAGHFNDPETYLGLAAGWYPGTNTLAPGSGFFLQPVANGTLTFVGEVKTTNSTVLPGGFSLIGSPFPASLSLTNLGLHGDAGDNVYRFVSTAGAQGAYGGGITSFSPDYWYDNDAPGGTGGPTAGPSLNVGEAVFYQNANAPYTWTQNFIIQ